MRSPSPMEVREAVVSYVLKFIGQPYEWGGDGRKWKGFDCSGLLCEVLMSAGLLPAKSDLNAQAIYDHFKGRAGNEVHWHGNIIFFGKSLTEITHIGLTINEYQYVEAGGGDHTNVAGMVRIRPRWYRSDVVAILDIIKE
jgi:cell wall-associated NlpC family hydrolase